MVLRSVSLFMFLGTKLQHSCALRYKYSDDDILKGLMEIDQENSQQLGKNPSTPNDANI